MKIRKIAVTNFRNHADSVMDIGDASFVCVRGPNTGGKTSIGQEAVMMALTLTAPGLPSAGQGFEKKIKFGESKAVISVDVQGKQHLVQRKVTLNTNTTGKSFEDTCLDDPAWIPMPFANHLKNNKEAVVVSVFTDYFIGMKDEGKQKNLIAKLVLPAKYDFPKDKRDSVNEILGSGEIDFDGDPFTAITKAYKKLYDARRDANRRVSEFLVPEPLPNSSVRSVDLKAQLVAAKEARQRILEEKDAAIKKSGELENERTRIKTKLDGILSQIEEDKAKLEKVEQNLLTEAKHKELSKIAAKKEDFDRLSKDRQICGITITTIKAEVDRLSDVLEKFADSGAKCPTCDQDVDMRVLESLLAEAQKELADVSEKDTEILRKLKEIGDVDGAIASIAKHEADKSERNVIHVAIAEKEKQANTGKAKLAAMGEQADTVGQFTEPLAQADKEISSLIEQLSPVIAAEERATEIETKTATLKKLNQQADTLDSLVKYFDKDGINATLLKEHIGPFESKINDVLAAWNYTASLSVEPWFFNVTKPNGDIVPISEISGAEEIEFACAFQCAVSRAAGIGLVVVDEVDRLLANLRPALYRKLYEMVSTGVLEQAIVILADDSQKVPSLPNSAWFWCESGTVRRLEGE